VQIAAPAASAASPSRFAIWIKASLAETDLRPEQRELTSAIVADLDARMAPSRAARQRLAAQIADEIAAGSLTEERLEARLAELTRSDESAGAVIDDAANKLFAAMEGPQRSRFLRAMRTNFRMAALDQGLRGKGKGKGKDKQQVRALIEELDLSKDQKHAIRAKVREEIKESAGEMRGQRHALRDRLREAARGFRGDQFDARGLGRDALALKRANLTIRLRVASAALPSLSAEQREKVAAHIRKQSESLD
jgi:hypothetical protein